MWGSSDGFVGVCVSAPKNTEALGSQMSAEQSHCTITSGHLGPINTARRLQLLFFFNLVSSCLFIFVLYLKAFSSSNSISMSVYNFTFYFAVFHRLLHAYYFSNSFLYSSNPWAHTSFFNRLPLLPLLHLKFHLFFPHTQLVANSVPSPPQTVVTFILCCFHLSLSWTLWQNVTSSLSASSSRANLLFKLVFTRFFTWRTYVLQSHTRNYHANYFAWHGEDF